MKSIITNITIHLLKFSIIFLYGGPGEIRTRVLNTSSLKGLQLYAYYSVLYLLCQVIISLFKVF